MRTSHIYWGRWIFCIISNTCNYYRYHRLAISRRTHKRWNYGRISLWRLNILFDNSLLCSVGINYNSTLLRSCWRGANSICLPISEYFKLHWNVNGGFSGWNIGARFFFATHCITDSKAGYSSVWIIRTSRKYYCTIPISGRRAPRHSAIGLTGPHRPGETTR